MGEQERLINTRGIVLWKFPAAEGTFYSSPLQPCNPLGWPGGVAGVGAKPPEHCHAKTLIFLCS